MATMKISKYTSSLLLLLFSLGLHAQKPEWAGLKIGADLSRLAIPFIDTTRYGWEITGDYEVINDLFLAAEFGSETTKLDKALYTYKSAGGYTRIGIDYNFMKHVDPESTDKMLVGLRYGFTTFYQKADNITITDEWWGNYSGGKIEKNWLAANWVEIVTGMNTQLFNNFYLGWSVRMRIKLGVTNDPLMEPYSIPGYGKAWNNTSVGINYTLSYKIPIYKKRLKKPDLK